jgi:hypothetical protein
MNAPQFHRLTRGLRMSRWNKDDIVHTDKDGFVVLDRQDLERVGAT